MIFRFALLITMISTSLPQTTINNQQPQPEQSQQQYSKFSAIKPLKESNFFSLGYQSIYDVCVLLVHCPLHQQFALCNSLHSGQHYRWFPFVYMSPTITWDNVRHQALEHILGISITKQKIQRITCLNVLRLQLPRTQRFVTRLLYYIRLQPKVFDPCVQTASKIDSTYIQWFSLDDAINGHINNLWGAEVVHYCKVIKTEDFVGRMLIEYSTKEMFDKLNKLPPKMEEMLRGNKVDYKDLERTFDDYIEHCFPSFFMSQVAFQCFLNKHGIETDQTRLDSYWNAFRGRNYPYLTFTDLTIGLVAIDRRTLHCESRLRFVFRLVFS